MAVFNIAEAEQRTPGSEMRSCGYRQPARRIHGKKLVRKIKMVTPQVGCWPMMRTDFCRTAVSLMDDAHEDEASGYIYPISGTISRGPSPSRKSRAARNAQN